MTYVRPSVLVAILAWSPLAQADIIFEDTGPQEETDEQPVDPGEEADSSVGCSGSGLTPTALASLALAGLLLRKRRDR